MSERNVARLRAAYEEFSASKRFDPQLLSSDVEFRQPEEGGDVLYRGHEGVARGIQSLVDVFDDFRAEAEEFFVAGSQIVVFVRMSGRARASGIQVDGRYAHVMTFRGEQIARWHTYTDRREALAQVGLGGLATPRSGSRRAPG